MLAKRKTKVALLLLLVLAALLAFSSCAGVFTNFFIEKIAEDEVQECQTFFTYVSQNNYGAAYDSVKYFVSPEDFEPFWQEARAVLGGSQGFVLSAKDWSAFTDSGYSYTDALILLTTDKGESTLIYAVLLEGDWLCGMQVVEVTDFVNATRWVPTADLVLSIFSFLAFAFSVWMFIDALVRRIKLKALWAILTLTSIGGGFTIGSTLKLLFNLWFIYPQSFVSIDYYELSVTARVLLPVGAIVYFFLRRRLPRKPDKNEMPVIPPLSPITPTPTDATAPTDVTAPTLDASVTPAATETAPAEVAPADTPAQAPVEAAPAETAPEAQEAE